MSTISASIVLLFLFGLFVCFVFTGNMLYPDVQVLMLLHWMILWVVKLMVEVPFRCENPPDTVIPSSLPVLTFNFQSLFSPLWLHLAHPDSWFYLVLSLADLTFWSHGPKSSKGTWAEWLWAVQNSSSLLRMELWACGEGMLFHLPDWRASWCREWRLILGTERQLYK